MSTPAPERDSPWIQTWSGKMAFPLDPREEDICIEDIAHSLSQMCRFTGHCDEPWSVASHSLEVMKALISMGRQDLALMGLLHDASESYLVDVPRPLKHWGEFGRLYREAEAKLTTCIFRKFGINQDGAIHPLVKMADNVALATEKRDLMTAISHVKWENLPEPAKDKLIMVTSKQAEAMFLTAFYKLTR